MRGTINAVTSSSPTTWPIAGALHSNLPASGPPSGNSASSIGLWPDCSSASITERREFGAVARMLPALRTVRVTFHERFFTEDLSGLSAATHPGISNVITSAERILRWRNWLFADARPLRTRNREDWWSSSKNEYWEAAGERDIPRSASGLNDYGVWGNAVTRSNEKVLLAVLRKVSDHIYV